MNRKSPMKTYLKALTLLLVLSGSAYLPNVYAENSTAMLITIAETSPALMERLDTIALTDAALLNDLLIMADSDPAQLERLLDLHAADPATFQQLLGIVAAENSDEGNASLLGTISDGGIIRN